MALPLNIEDLLNARTVESVRIEFKRGWNPEEVMHSICALANDIKEYGSAYIIIGVEEKDGVAVLPPAGLNDNQIDPIQKELINICYKLKPNYFPIIEPAIFQGKHIIVIWVTTGEERPYSAPVFLGVKGGEYRRIYVRPASITIPATVELETELRKLSAHRHFDDRINTQSSINDFDLGLILSYLQEVGSQLYHDAPKTALLDLAVNMQIARGPKENIKPLNVGLLMFCKTPEKYFDGCKTNMIEFEDEAGTRYSDKQFTGPIHIQIRQIMDYLKGNIIKRFTRKVESKQEVETFFNYPYLSLEESVVNALYHRSYEDPTPNEIRIYTYGVSRRIEILSYPGPLPPIDRNSLLQFNVAARSYRNIRLGEFLKNLRLAEKFATGIPTIVKTLKENGSPPPALVTDENRSYFLTVVNIHEDTPRPENKDQITVQEILLSNKHQAILEALKREPLEEQSIKQLFKEDISEDINFLTERELLKMKLIRDLKLLYVTPKGLEALRVSF